MASLDNVVSVSISKQTSVVATSTFGVPAILCQFTTARTTTTFGRSRYYSSLAELSADGWSTTDSVYLAAQKLMGQVKKVPRFMVGRIDSTDATIAAALDAIQLETKDWYCFTTLGTLTAAATFSGVLVTGNVINMTVAGETVASQTFATDHATTMTQLAAKVVTALTRTGFATPTCTVATNTLNIAQVGRDINSATAVITLGASQASLSTVYTLDSTKTLGAAAWVATQTKMFGFSDSDTNTLSGAATSDLAYQLKQLAYARTWYIYHAKPSEYAHVAWMGLELAKHPGKSTWAEKTLSGITPDDITEGQLSAATAKNCNTYTPIANAGRTLWGKTSSGENIEITRNLDYLQSSIQADNATLKFSRDIVPANDDGVVLELGTLEGTLDRMETEGILIPGTAVPTAKRYAEWAAADKASGTNRMTFTAGVQGAILKSVIDGTVTL